MRLSEYAKKNNKTIRVFDEKIEPSYIKQGSLRDCYLLSYLSALTELPERVKSIFICKSYPHWKLEDILEESIKQGIF